MFYPNREFVSTLSEAEKFIFLKVICGMVASDRRVSKNEIRYLRELAVQYGASADSISAMVKSSDTKALLKQARMITDRKKALTLIKDLCMVANNDIELEDKEIDYILDVADIVGIDPIRVKDINVVVSSYLDCEKNMRKLLELED